MAFNSSFQSGLDLLEYRDFFYKGYKTNQAFVVTQVDAIKNALKLYLFSKKGDYGRDIDKGGPLVGFLGKPLNNATKIQLEEAILSALSQYNNIVVNELNVIENRQDHKWSIQISFSDTFHKYKDSLSFEMG